MNILCIERRSIPVLIRLQIASQLVQDYGIPLAEVARQLGVSTSAISRAIASTISPLTFKLVTRPEPSWDIRISTAGSCSGSIVK